MTLKDIQNGVKEVLAQNSRYTRDEIRLDARIDTYVSSFFADRLAAELTRHFPAIDMTAMTNNLFNTLIKVSDIADAIKPYYQIDE